MYQNEHFLFEHNGGRHRQLLAEAEVERLAIQVDKAKVRRGASLAGINWPRLAVTAGAIAGLALVVAFNLL